jgi:hypothetical protein
VVKKVDVRLWDVEQRLLIAVLERERDLPEEWQYEEIADLIAEREEVLEPLGRS